MNILILLLLLTTNLFTQEVIILTNDNILNEQQFLQYYLDTSLETKAIHSRILASNQKKAIAFQPYMGSIFADVGYIAGTTTNSQISGHNILTNSTTTGTNTLRVDFTNINASLGADATIYPSGTYLKVQGGVKEFDTQSFTMNINFPTSPTTPFSFDSDKYRDRYTIPYFNVTLVQPWLKNGFAYGMHRRVIQIASNDILIDNNQAKKDIEQITLNALIQYHKLILQTKLIAIAEESVDELDQIYQTQQRLQRAGARAAFDIQQIELKLKDVNNYLTQEKNRLELAFQILEGRINHPLNRTNLNLLDYSSATTNDFTAESIYEIARENSTDLKHLGLLLQNIQHSSKIIANQNLPELNTILSYEITESLYRDNPQLNSFSVPQDNLYFGVQFKMPFAHNANNAKKRQVQAQSNQIANNQQFVEKTLQELSQEKFVEWANYHYSMNQHQDQLKLNRTIVAEALRRYRISEMSITDYFDYEEQYRENQRKLAYNEFHFKISSIGIEALQGTLLQNYGIEFE